jgi:predicted CXXCH cytochrome family protein
VASVTVKYIGLESQKFGGDMRKLVLTKITVLFAACLLSTGAMATSIKAPGIRGSDHDFAKFLMTTSTVSASTGATTVKSYDEICIFCHTPHRNGAGQVGSGDVGNDAPLWNHAVSSATYTPYTSATMNAVPGQPNGVSKLCLGCHDGTIALEAYGKTATGTHFISDAQFGSGSKVIGTDLTNDHPISFVFDSALVAADGELNDPASSDILQITTVATPVTQSLVGNVAEKLLDKSGQVQCTSCHDAHNGQGINKLLKVNNAGSALCLTCHKK